MRERPPAGCRRRLGGIRWAAAVLAAAVTLLGTPGPAGASEVTAGELHELVQRALSDPGELPALRRVDAVDGRPVDVGRALDGASGAELRSRLLALDPGPAGAPATTGVSGDPGAQARRILEDRRFHPTPVPRPFRGLFRTLGRWLRPVSGPIGRAWSALFDQAWTAGLVGAAVVLAAAVVSLRVIHGHSSAAVDRTRRHRQPGGHGDPDALERQADGAEREGDLELALRLRFRAGLARLDRAGVVADRPALTPGGVARAVPSAQVRALATAFEEVVYGRRPATTDDVAAARDGWVRVLDEARP